MHFSTLLLASIPLSLVSAHGKVAAVQGDAGGNGTALGRNKVTETDTTVFGKTNVATDGLGKTTGGGQNKAADLSSTMAQSGSTLPQVSDGGSIAGTFHIVTTDGAGPVSAMIDPTATGQFSQGVQANVMTDVPGNKGNIKANGNVPRGLSYWALRARGLVKRAANVNMDFPINVAIPAGTTCSGSVAGQQNVCFMKIANANKAGPFGGVIAFQMAGASAGNTTAAAGTAAGSAAGASSAGAGSPEAGLAGAGTTAGANSASGANSVLGANSAAGANSAGGATVAKRFSA